jgi:hypothetical protein
VPLIIDLAKTDEQRQILKLIFARQVMGRPFVGPPEHSADRVEARAQAFMDTLNDKRARRPEAETAQLEINPGGRRHVQALVGEVYRTPAKERSVAKARLSLLDRERPSAAEKRAGSEELRGWQSDVIVDLIKRYGFPTSRSIRGELPRPARLAGQLRRQRAADDAVQPRGNRRADRARYAKATGKPMAVILHDLVGLLHACMAIYYA